MAKTKDVKPFVDAMKDEEFRENLKSAFVAARDVYDELMGPRGVSGKAMRVAYDQEMSENLKKVIEDPREVADRVQNGPSHKGRNTLLVTGIALGVLLFNPMTGADTRKWLKETVFGDEDEFGYQGSNSNN